jgi:ketopantoate reductase
MDVTKSKILLVGCGGVGTMCAYNLEIGGRALITAVLRSNYDAVEREGFFIDSIEHGKVEGWRPSESMFDTS